MMPYYLNELMMSGNYFAMRKCAILPLNLGGMRQLMVLSSEKKSYLVKFSVYLLFIIQEKI